MTSTLPAGRKEAYQRYLEDLGDEELVAQAASDDDEARKAAEIARASAEVVFARMTRDGASILLGENGQKAEIGGGGKVYEWMQADLWAAWELLKAAGEKPTKYIRDGREYVFRTQEDAATVLAKLTEAGVEWEHFIELKGELSAKNSAHLITWLQKLGPRSQHVHYSAEASPGTKVTFTGTLGSHADLPAQGD